MTTNSQLATMGPKKQKQKLIKQLEQEQNHRNGDTWRVISGEGEKGEWEKKGQGIRSILCRHKIDRVRIV